MEIKTISASYYATIPDPHVRYANHKLGVTLTVETDGGNIEIVSDELYEQCKAEVARFRTLITGE